VCGQRPCATTLNVRLQGKVKHVTREVMISMWWIYIVMPILFALAIYGFVSRRQLVLACGSDPVLSARCYLARRGSLPGARIRSRRVTRPAAAVRETIVTSWPCW